MIRRRPPDPVRPNADGFDIELRDDERDLVLRLLGELRELLTEPDPDGDAAVLVARLFPVVHPDDEDAEAEYQRLMRDELVQSKLAAFDRVEAALTGDGEVDEGGLIAFMQSVNTIRLVLGTMLGVTDDPDVDEVADGLGDSPEYHLYAFLSWLLEQSVRALTGD